MPLSTTDMDAAHTRLQERYGRITPLALLEIARDAETTTADRLDALTVIQLMRADLDLAEYAALESGRRESSWSALGAALGMTRQGAERRWLRLAPKGTPSRDADAGRRSRQQRA